MNPLALQIFELTPEIVCVRRPSYLACFYVLLLGDQTILIDAGMQSSGADVRSAMDFVDRPLDSISTIALTHWHNDHAAGAAWVKERTDCDVIYHQGDAPFLRRETATSAVRNWSASLTPELGLFVLAKGLIGNATPTAVDADRIIADGDRIADTLEVIATPGHTPGHVCFRYGTTLFAGDALAVQGRQLRYMSKRVTLEIPDALASMRRLVEDDYDLICAGHRRPLDNATAAWATFRSRVNAGDHWPYLG